MLPIDEPVAGLVEAGEVWIWAVPHPDDAEPAEHPTVTRIGRREVGQLVGHLAITTTAARPFDHPAHRLTGMGPWRRTKVGSVSIPYTDGAAPRTQATVQSARVQARWNGAGLLHVGEHKESSALATRGNPPTAPVDLRDVADTVVGLGRSLLRRARGDREALDVPTPPALGTPIDEPLAAFDGWMTATQHLVGGVESWQLALDPSRPTPSSPGLAMALAAVALVHHPSLTG